MSNWQKEVSKILEENPFKIMEILEDMHEDWGKSVEEYFCRHIIDEKQYEKYTKYFTNFDKTTGPYWTVSQVKEKAGIDFTTKDYTCYDFAYAVNMVYSDNGDFMTPEHIFKSAKRWLEDMDSGIVDPSTRAYLDGKQRYTRFNKK